MDPSGRPFKVLDDIRLWEPPGDWLKITTIDLHTAGEPFRVITGGLPGLPGETILERRRYLQREMDHLRTALMWEPRGHADMYGCIVTPPVSPDADFGVIFLHNEGYSTMCGHGIIGIVTAVLETGAFQIEAPEAGIAIDTPAGRVNAWAEVGAGRVRSVRFHNVPSFVLCRDETVEVSGLGKVRYDIAFGGAFYAFVRAEEVGMKLNPAEFSRLVEKGMAVKREIMAKRPIEHPFEADLGFLYGTIFTGPAESAGGHSRHVCVFAEGEVDRSPTGTGVSARLALLHDSGEIVIRAPIAVESIIGSHFRGRIVEETPFGPYPAIIPEIEGGAHITGRHEFLIDPDDPMKDGFILR